MNDSQLIWEAYEHNFEYGPLAKFAGKPTKPGQFAEGVDEVFLRRAILEHIATEFRQRLSWEFLDEEHFPKPYANFAFGTQFTIATSYGGGDMGDADNIEVHMQVPDPLKGDGWQYETESQKVMKMECILMPGSMASLNTSKFDTSDYRDRSGVAGRKDDTNLNIPGGWRKVPTSEAPEDAPDVEGEPGQKWIHPHHGTDWFLPKAVVPRAWGQVRSATEGERIFPTDIDHHAYLVSDVLTKTGVKRQDGPNAKLEINNQGIPQLREIIDEIYQYLFDWGGGGFDGGDFDPAPVRPIVTPDAVTA